MDSKELGELRACPVVQDSQDQWDLSAQWVSLEPAALTESLATPVSRDKPDQQVLEVLTARRDSEA